MSEIITLSNGLKVANFSSPHTFTFTDGSVLPARDHVFSRFMSLDDGETIESVNVSKKCIYTNVSVHWKLTAAIEIELLRWMREYHMNNIDIVIVPLPVLSAMKTTRWSKQNIINSPFRVVRVADRITKEIHINKFCI